jgi:hypothetical protein
MSRTHGINCIKEGAIFNIGALEYETVQNLELNGGEYRT